MHAYSLTGISEEISQKIASYLAIGGFFDISDPNTLGKAIILCKASKKYMRIQAPESTILNEILEKVCKNSFPVDTNTTLIYSRHDEMFGPETQEKFLQNHPGRLIISESTEKDGNSYHDSCNVAPKIILNILRMQR